MARESRRQIEWCELGTYPDRFAAEIDAGYLRSQEVPARVEVLSDVPGLERGAQVWVDAALLHRARWLLKLGPVSDAELEYLATGRFPDPAADASRPEGAARDPMNLNTVRVFVRDLDNAKAFYANVLGLRLKGGRTELGYCVFDAGNTQLVLESVPADAPGEDQALVGRFTGLSFEVADVEARYRELAALGVRFTGEPERQAWGGVLATFQDPEGNEMQIAQPAVQ